MSKRILIFSLAYLPKHIGGAEIAIKEITDRTLPDEYEFFMVTNRYDSTLPRYEKVGKVHVYRIGITKNNPNMADLRKWPLHLNKFLYQVSAVWKARQINRIHNFNASWAMTAHSCGIPAMLFKAISGIPYLLTLQEGDPPEYIEKKMRIVWPLFIRSFTHARRIQTISTFLARWARHMGFDGPLDTIPNGVSVKIFSKPISMPERGKAKRELVKKSGDVFLVTASRLVYKNGLDDVIKALDLLPKHTNFVIFGTGPDEETLKTLARGTGVAGRVHFRGVVSHAEMPRLFAACDIFVRPSRSEGMGSAFVEAFAAGLPVIATQEGGIADFLFDAKRNPDKETTGWAVSPNAPEQIAAAIKDILVHPEQVKKVTENARRMVVETYDWDIVARDMKEKCFDRLFS